MTLPRPVAQVLKDHVTLEVEGIDRMYLNYFYGLDEDFGPFFIKFCTYFPYNAKLCINGHEYVKRQLAKEGIAFEALDNGIRACATPQRLQELCDGLSAAQ